MARGVWDPYRGLGVHDVKFIGPGPALKPTVSHVKYRRLKAMQGYGEEEIDNNGKPKED
jgi:hypothetical protein